MIVVSFLLALEVIGLPSPLGEAPLESLFNTKLPSKSFLASGLWLNETRTKMSASVAKRAM